ncbi:MAG: hypothetical protein KatS3mg113_1124 [Planctomycetaceae bacterium]|nr:MAG: hypothetical protein KatS3mg113_1124 [Planctomycetaceae bacterium]
MIDGKNPPATSDLSLQWLEIRTALERYGIHGMSLQLFSLRGAPNTGKVTAD